MGFLGIPATARNVKVPRELVAVRRGAAASAGVTAVPAAATMEKACRTRVVVGQDIRKQDIRDGIGLRSTVAKGRQRRKETHCRTIYVVFLQIDHFLRSNSLRKGRFPFTIGKVVSLHEPQS